MLKTVLAELQSDEAKRELCTFITAHRYLQQEFKHLNRDDKAICDAVEILKSEKQYSLVQRLKRILGRGYFNF